MLNNAKELLQRILNHIENGGTVYICTPLRKTYINKKVNERFKKAGYELIKEKNNSLYLASGKKFVCIDYCDFIFD